MNPAHKTIQEVQRLYEARLAEIDDYEEQANSPLALQLDTALGVIGHSNAFRIIHPLLIKRYARPKMKFKTEPIRCIGLDVETVHTTGEPKLLGIFNPEPSGVYQAFVNPTIENLYNVVDGISRNGNGQHLCVWGNLDIQIILRLFDPTERERVMISRGISSRVKDGEFMADPPIMRMVDGSRFYVAHYIPGRSLKLGILDPKGYESTVWVFNLSQFFPGTIKQTAAALGLYWQDFPKDTHLVDWERFEIDEIYAQTVKFSNRQDALTVQRFSHLLQAQFYAAFEVYPSLLVSTGSLTDAAVAHMLDDEDYKACAWDWLRHHAWKSNQDEVVKAETLLAEAFSAGYVDQFAVGYFDRICTADIAAAYPHKIRNLPDLRDCEIIAGEGFENLDRIRQKYDLESAVIRGHVTIPTSLHFHPITIKTYNRENYRPIGTFWAAYTLEERDFCISHGATFETEEWCAFVIHTREPSPLSKVSTQLGKMRDALLAELKETEKDTDRYIFLDGQQYVTKVIDNSIYGKTVMTTEFVENIDGLPTITGLISGDRFNMLSGTLITSRTRIQIAEACCAIEQAGGRPIMTMTDSVYWEGDLSDLPAEFINVVKTPGFFEAPEVVEDMYLLKTGQYEYSKKGFYTYKLRGLPVLWETLGADENGKYQRSFYRRLLKEAKIKPYTHPADIKIPMTTRKLLSIGSSNLHNLGLIKESETVLKPFLMSSKQASRFVMNWEQAIDGHVWLDVPTVRPESGATQAPLFFLAELYQDGMAHVQETRVTNRRQHTVIRVHNIRDQKRLYLVRAMRSTGVVPPDGDLMELTWNELETHFGVKRNVLL